MFSESPEEQEQLLYGHTTYSRQYHPGHREILKVSKYQVNYQGIIRHITLGVIHITLY